MRMAPTQVLVLHDDASLNAELARLPWSAFRYRSVAGWNALAQALRDASASSIPVVDPYFGVKDGRLATGLRQVLADFPSVAVAAALRVNGERIDDLHTLAKWGVVEIVSIGHDDTAAALAQRFRGMRGHRLKQRIHSLLPPATSGRARAILDAAAEIAVAGGSGHDLAEHLSLSRRTLLRWTEASGLPPVRELLAWLRILLAAEVLDDPGRTVLQVANAAGYGADSGLRRITSKYVDMSPREMRDHGAAAAAGTRFKASLDQRAHGSQAPTEP